MTLRECYDKMGANLDEVLNRIPSEETIIKFVGLFPEDDSYANLKESLLRGDIETAFRSAHTLKGVCMNLSFTKLIKSSEALTNSLRPENRKDYTKEEIESLFANTTADYEEAVAIAREFSNQMPAD